MPSCSFVGEVIILTAIFGTDGGIGTDNKEQMANEKYQNKNMWFGARQLTPLTINSSSVNLFNSKFRFSMNVL